MNETPTIRLMRLPHGDGLALPAYESEQAAGVDLRAAVPENAPLTLMPGERALVATGFRVALEAGFELQVRPRSGLAVRHGLTVLNSPGTVDADYRGELKVALVNHGAEPVTLTRGMRIAQGVVAPVVQAAVVEGTVEDDTARGSGGFGSTGA